MSSISTCQHDFGSYSIVARFAALLYCSIVTARVGYKVGPDSELGHNQRLIGNVLQWVSLASLLISGLKSNGFATRVANLAQEQPPIDFRVDYFSKAHASPFGRFDFLNTVLINMATTAVLPWNSNVPAERYPAPYGIAIGFVSDRSGPGLLAKHIMWTIEQIFDKVVRDARYLPANVVVKLGATTLGVGNVYFASTDSTPVDLLSNASLQLNAHGQVQLAYWYREGGIHVDDAGVYSATLKLLIKAAEPSDLKAGIWPGLSTYNDQHDFTFTIRSESLATRNDLSWFDAIFALSTIPITMYQQGGTPGKFMELDGVITVGTTVVGRFCIESGNQTGLDLQGLCNRGDQESDHGVEVAIS